MEIYTAAQKRDANTFSDKTTVYVLRASAMCLTAFLSSALNWNCNRFIIFSIAKLLKSLAICSINDRDLFFYVIRVSICVCCFRQITKGTYCMLLLI